MRIAASYLADALCTFVYRPGQCSRRRVAIRSEAGKTGEQAALCTHLLVTDSKQALS